MQEENRSKSEFSQRADRLAEKLRVSKRDLPKYLKLAPSTFWDACSEKSLRAISPKSLNKLRSVEIGAGLILPDQQPASKLETVVAEDEQDHQRSDTPLETEIRSIMAELIAAANGDPTRLGWILEQMREHLTAPKHWKRHPRDEVVRVTLPSQKVQYPNPSRHSQSA